MAIIHFSTGLTALTGGQAVVEVEASSVQQLLLELERRFPGIGAQIRAGMAIAIDGEIIQEPLLEKLDRSSEVHFLPPIGGG